ncbi:hypothetical protein [Streptomyces sp. SPB4]|uniref:hypothetical protein n=1 Tax=Streptomyces sp. SPB4 TaxID=2940553 RepID=UPI002475C10A|nr:hypothetical protein [Streptomyces sp. SPB4]MDH6541675.1 hypothetical protein [Streptomyces sp. SPB4]
MTERQRDARPAQALSSSERMTRSFHLTCLATLIPHHQRCAALDAWLDVDRGLFHMGFDPPAPVTEAVLRLGGDRLRTALASAVRSERTQLALIELEVPAIDTALRHNHLLGPQSTRLLRLRDPAASAAGRAYDPYDHRRDLLSPDPDLAAAALLDPRHGAGRAERGGGGSWITTRAAAWDTVRAAGGVARVRAVAARLPRVDEDPVGADVLAACAEQDPEPFLDTVLEHRLGTGALLRRLRAEHRAAQGQQQARRALYLVLKEPYRLDWGLLAAARLGRRIPRSAAVMLAERPDCPPEVAVVLRTGRPARPGRPLPPPAPPPPAPAPRRPDRTHRVPEWKPPGDTGPLGESADSARRALRTLPVAYDTRDGAAVVTLDQLGAAIERGLLTAAEAVPLVRPASVLTSWVGQGSGWASVSNAAWSGRAALHVETAALVARWASGHVPAGHWAALHPLLRHHPGTLPELLAAASGARPDRPTG